MAVTTRWEAMWGWRAPDQQLDTRRVLLIFSHSVDAVVFVSRNCDEVSLGTTASPPLLYVPRSSLLCLLLHQCDGALQMWSWFKAWEKEYNTLLVITLKQKLQKYIVLKYFHLKLVRWTTGGSVAQFNRWDKGRKEKKKRCWRIRVYQQDGYWWSWKSVLSLDGDAITTERQQASSKRLIKDNKEMTIKAKCKEPHVETIFFYFMFCLMITCSLAYNNTSPLYYTSGSQMRGECVPL